MGREVENETRKMEIRGAVSTGAVAWGLIGSRSRKQGRQAAAGVFAEWAGGWQVHLVDLRRGRTEVPPLHFLVYKRSVVAMAQPCRCVGCCWLEDS